MKKTTGLTHLVKATGYSLHGLKHTFKYEAGFRHELGLACFLIPLACYLAHDKIELILLIGSVLLVLLTELLNSAIESVVDRIGEDYHELSGRAKDQGSAAVLIALVIMVMTWGGILFF